MTALPTPALLEVPPESKQGRRSPLAPPSEASEHSQAASMQTACPCDAHQADGAACHLAHVWERLRASVDAAAPQTAAEFAQRAEALCAILAEGLASVPPADDDCAHLEALVRQSRGHRKAMKYATLAACAADIEGQLGAFADAADRLGRLAEPKPTATKAEE